MIFKTIALVGLVGFDLAAANKMNVRMRKVEDAPMEHLDLELEVEGGERKLFPLLPGTRCPAGHKCHVRAPPSSFQFDKHPASASVDGFVRSIKDSCKTPLASTLNWGEISNTFNTIVASDDYCSRRNAMKKAAGIAAGVAVATAGKPAYAAETKEVKMGTDAGGLQFVPAKSSVCKGDSIKWINNKAGPHNVVFDEDAIPSGVSQEKISMEDQLGEEGETYVLMFDTPGNYEYFCEPHRGAGMNGAVTVA